MKKIIFYPIFLFSFSLIKGAEVNEINQNLTYEVRKQTLDKILKQKTSPINKSTNEDLSFQRNLFKKAQEKLNYFGYYPYFTLFIYPNAILINLKQAVEFENVFAYIFIIKKEKQYIGFLRQNELLTKLEGPQLKNIFHKHLEYLKYNCENNIAFLTTNEIDNELRQLDSSECYLIHHHLIKLINLIEIELFRSAFFNEYLTKLVNKELSLASAIYEKMYTKKS